MSKSKGGFYDCVTQDTPRFVVTFIHKDGAEQFQWGMVGVIPILSLVGCMFRVQSELSFRAAQECPEVALVIAWDEEKRECDWWVHPSIPIDPLVGMLDTIRATVVATHLARQAAAQQIVHPKLLGPDGQPFRKV